MVLTHLSKEWSDLAELDIKQYLNLPQSSPLDMGIRVQGDTLDQFNELSEQKIHLWSFAEDCNGRQCTNAAARLRDALSILEGYDISPSIEWNISHEELKQNPKGRLQVFAYELNHLLQLAKSFPTSFFIDWTDWHTEFLILNDGTQVPRTYLEPKCVDKSNFFTCLVNKIDILHVAIAVGLVGLIILPFAIVRSSATTVST